MQGEYGRVQHITVLFPEKKRGQKSSGNGKTAVDTILLLRKKYLSVKDIKAIMDARQIGVTEGFIYTTDFHGINAP